MMKNVLVYTLNYCPFCKKAMDFLTQKGIPFENIDITYNEETMTERIKKMFNLTGEVTFPQIVIGTETIGGYTNLRKLAHKGKLEELLH